MMEDSTYFSAGQAAGADGTILPADSAFTEGKLLLPLTESRPMETRQDGTPRGDGVVPGLIMSVMTVFFIIFVRKIMGILPMVAGSLLRWKENLNIEYNVKSARDRTTLALILFPGFCVTIWKYGVLWDSGFPTEVSPAAGILLTACAFVIFMLLRALLIRILRPSRMNMKVWEAGNRALYTFFDAAAVIIIAVSAAMQFSGCGTDAIRMTIIYISAIVWCIFLFRKMQIFKNSCSLFSAILYLCTLEILPMAAIVAAAVMI